MRYILELDINNNVSIYPDGNDLVIIDGIKFKELTEQEYRQAMNKIKIGYYPKWNGSLIFEKVVQNIYVDPSKFDTPYYAYKMEQEGILTDFYSYMDEKLEYDAQVQAEEQAKQEAYENELMYNPELTWEEFLMNHPTTITSLEEPVIPETVQAFMNKYLGVKATQQSKINYTSDQNTFQKW